MLHNWCNKGRRMCYAVCGIEEPLLLIRKSSLCGGIGFPFSLAEWSLTICLMPYNRKWNVFSASLNKTFPSFLPLRCSGSSDRSLMVDPFCYFLIKQLPQKSTMKRTLLPRSYILLPVWEWEQGIASVVEHPLIVHPLSYFSFQPVLHDWCQRPWYVLSYLWDGAIHKSDRT